MRWTTMLLLLMSGIFAADAQNTPTPVNTSPTPRKSTLAEQSQVSLTVYNSNIALVREQRAVDLAAGRNLLQFMDVAAQIIPATVHVKSLSDSQDLQVLEQNYEYDLLSPEKLLEKYVGKEVKLFDKNYYTGKDEVVTGTLLSTNGGTIYQIGNEIHLNPPGRVILPQVPDNLIAHPTLVWMLQASTAGKHQLEASYLTNQVTWQADYIAVLNTDDTLVDLSGWVTLDNKSGATYQNAALKLVAGDVHRLTPPEVYEKTMVMMASARSAEPQFKEEGLFEYHLYTLDRPTTLKDKQTKQLALLSATAIPVTKRFIFRGEPRYFYGMYGEDTFQKQKVIVELEIENAKKNNLGIPLPKGTVRVYKADSEGSSQFLGEDAIDHTPVDETFTIKTGDAFDVVGERKQTEFKQISPTVTESAWEISLRNRKTEDITVRVIEPVPGDWEVLSTSHKYTKTDAHTLQFEVSVPKSREVKVTYRVRVKR